MVLRLDQQPKVENLRNHPAETVEKLRQLLVSGTQAQPDPRRANFFEIENCSQVFYIHISPINGKVFLLGIWQRKAEPVATGAAKVHQAT
jgi:hypothetical protein